jgi:hypothetical protein
VSKQLIDLQNFVNSNYTTVNPWYDHWVWRV